MSTEVTSPERGREAVLAWSAVGSAGLAVFAWAACCVLPMALAITGLSLAGSAAVAGQRTWVTLGAGLILAAGWWRVWRRQRACASDGACAPPARLSVTLLAVATLLLLIALLWQPMIEPRALMILRSLLG